MICARLQTGRTYSRLPPEGFKQEVPIHFFLQKASTLEAAEEIALAVEASQRLKTLHNTEVAADRNLRDIAPKARDSRET